MKYLPALAALLSILACTLWIVALSGPWYHVQNKDGTEQHMGLYDSYQRGKPHDDEYEHSKYKHNMLNDEMTMNAISQHDKYYGDDEYDDESHHNHKHKHEHEQRHKHKHGHHEEEEENEQQDTNKSKKEEYPTFQPIIIQPTQPDNINPPTTQAPMSSEPTGTGDLQRVSGGGGAGGGGFGDFGGGGGGHGGPTGGAGGGSGGVGVVMSTIPTPGPSAIPADSHHVATPVPTSKHGRVYRQPHHDYGKHHDQNDEYESHHMHHDHHHQEEEYEGHHGDHHHDKHHDQNDEYESHHHNKHHPDHHLDKHHPDHHRNKHHHHDDEEDEYESMSLNQAGNELPEQGSTQGNEQEQEYGHGRYLKKHPTKHEIERTNAFPYDETWVKAMKILLYLAIIVSGIAALLQLLMAWTVGQKLHQGSWTTSPTTAIIATTLIALAGVHGLIVLFLFLSKRHELPKHGYYDYGYALNITATILSFISPILFWYTLDTSRTKYESLIGEENIAGGRRKYASVE